MSDTLTQMVTYRGTDSQTQQSVTITARSAYENIDPGAIKKAVDDVNTAMEDAIKSINDALKVPEDESDYALVMTGTKVDEVIEKAGSELKSIPGQISSQLEGIYGEAVKVFNTIQTQYNSDAEAKKGSYPNVTNWSESYSSGGGD